MNENRWSGPDEEECPKRVWVMLTLSDDEALEEGESLPPGLRFHLSRCESCRKVAEHLQAASAKLRDLVGLQPPDDLGVRADAQLRRALRAGAELTGRVVIPEDQTPQTPSPGPASRIRVIRYAAAAAVFIGFGLAGVWVLRGPSPPRVAEETGPDETVAPAVAGAPDARPPLPPDSSDQSSAHVATESRSPRTDKRLADTSTVRPAAAGPVRRSRSRPLCRHRSHVEAALCEDVNCIHRAVIVPPRGTRDLGWGNRLFDNPPATVSTRRHSDGE